ncbi:GAD-like-domain-containing protein [Neocallimastix lanati (nom. inval.)]|jgi:hypothetical protein|uniref:GAD-like-domain-containing protein n=1 Tax=Neocallimastix californiae TaxID=1754190 RepID=A0A1Y2DEF2_9FUNG|nr:GAD-like-domain-containing protein [Neocallimastix sp. JGI-2020a]ORY57648.1 GAD-like-domain-containing protein [Neocallimastix californiae]|eukprot:ORY57648.1 GAD-like-domain-containing protein [Neocallimastix californiae]
MPFDKEEEDFFSFFVKNFKPGNDLIKPNEDIIKKLESIVPQQLVKFWKEYGFGNYGDGIIKVINPFDYTESLYTWLGGEDKNKVPIMLTAFGDIFYYRKITDTEDDVCLLDIHYKNINVCSYSFSEFFEDYLLDEDIQNDILRKPLFLEAKEKEGELKLNEIFLFTPALAIGGAEELKYIKKGDAAVHQNLLLQL